MPRSVYVWREGLGVIPKDEAPPRIGGAYVIRDQQDALLHPATGEMIDSKSRFRQRTKDAGCIEIGTEKLTPKPRVKPDLRKDVAKAMQMVREGYRPQIMSRGDWDNG